MSDIVDKVTGEQLYPCDDCGKLRAVAEGGTIFTVCDDCWDRHFKRAAPHTAELLDEVKRLRAEGDNLVERENALRELLATKDREIEHHRAELARLDGELAKAKTEIRNLRSIKCMNSGACEGEPHTCEQELIAGLEGKHDRLAMRIADIANEAFGPYPVQTIEENLTAIERGIFEQRRRIAEVSGRQDKRERKSLGICQSCNNLVVPGKSRCIKHLEAMRANANRKRRKTR